MKQLSVRPKRAMTRGEVGWILGVSGPIVKKLIADGRLRAVQISETSIRIMPDDLEAFIREHQTAPKKETFSIAFK